MNKTVPDWLEQKVEVGIAARGWIVNGYAQFENLLSDLVMRARTLPEYEDLAVPYRTAKRISAVRELLSRKGPLSEYRTFIGELVDDFETFEDTRLMLVHAFAHVLHTDDQSVGFEFQLHRMGEGNVPMVLSRVFRLEELVAHRQMFNAFADEALHRFLHVHTKMGWA